MMFGNPISVFRKTTVLKRIGSKDEKCQSWLLIIINIFVMLLMLGGLGVGVYDVAMSLLKEAKPNIVFDIVGGFSLIYWVFALHDYCRKT